jgi:hypothetical protein
MIGLAAGPAWAGGGAGAFLATGNGAFSNAGQLNGNSEMDAGGLTFDQATAQTLSTVITSAGSVIQDGAGTLTLSGRPNRYRVGTAERAHAAGTEHTSSPPPHFSNQKPDRKRWMALSG